MMEQFKLYVETDDAFSICVGEHADFQSAKQQFQKMVSDLVGNQKLLNSLIWDEFMEEEFPDTIKNILLAYASEGYAATQEDAEGDTCNYHYAIAGDYFEIIDSEDAEYAPNYSLQTNTLGMDGSKDEYRFRMWTGTGMADQALIIRLRRAV